MNSDIINECINVIITYLSGSIGDKNIISVILTGSAARNQATFRYVEGKVSLESDLDLVIVVKYAAIIKSFILVKRLSKEITSDLVKRRLILSHVSFSVTTEKALLNSPPSIFYQDLSHNGKVVFGKDIRNTLRSYDTNEIPIQDLYRLLLNRMIESLEALVLCGAFEGKLSKHSLNLIFKSLKKLNFAFIQAMLIKEDILIFNISKIQTVRSNQLKNQQTLDYLLKSYDELIAISELQQENDCSMDTIERYWRRIISQFDSIMKLLYEIAESTPTSTSTRSSPHSPPTNISGSIEKTLFKNEHLSYRLKTSLMIFLQYFEIRKTREVLWAIIFVIRFGSDHVYFLLYDLFLSSQSILKVAVGKEDNATYQQKEQQQYEPFNNTKSCDIYSKKRWLKAYIKYLSVWKYKTGG